MNIVDLENIILKNKQWIESVHHKTLDWWDIWGEGFGRWAKDVYVKKPLTGIIPVGIVFTLDTVYPEFRKLFVRPRKFPICQAHIALANLNLWKYYDDAKYFQQTIYLGNELLDLASPKIENLGWGMKHKWMTVQGLIPEDTPCNTQTAYPYLLYSQLYECTNEEKYQAYLNSILNHVMNDFNESVDGNIISCSYSTADKRRVINANSYRMFMLIDGGVRFKRSDIFEKGLSTFRYVKKMQSKEGSWPYSEDQDFIDNYHTCFVLKNLLKVRKILDINFEDIDAVIDKGYSYFRKKLFNRSKYPVPFSLEPRYVNYKYDSYDLAESISLYQDFDEPNNEIDHLLDFAFSAFFTQKGWFKFRINKFPSRSIPYMRYANSAMFLAMTKVLIHRKNRT